MSEEFREKEFLGRVQRLDPVEQVILLFAMKGLVSGHLTSKQLECLTGELVERHRAGHELRLSDLDCLVGAAA